MNSTDMKNEKKHNGRGRTREDAPELRVVAINCNPGPDAQDRLRRLFTILLRYAAEDVGRQPPASPSSEDSVEEES